MDLSRIHCVLSQEVGKFNIVTAGVDYLTFKAESRGAKTAIQVLTYASGPIELLIQLAASPIFALYQTCHGVAKSIQDKNYIGAAAKVLVSPIGFALNVIGNVLSTSCVLTPLGVVIPLRLIANCIYPEFRSSYRILQMNFKYPFMFETTTGSQSIQGWYITLQGQAQIHLLAKYKFNVLNNQEYKNQVNDVWSKGPRGIALIREIVSQMVSKIRTSVNVYRA